MKDFISHDGNYTLAIGIRNNNVVFGVSDKSGNTAHVTLNGSSAARAADWLAEASATIPRSSGAELLRAANSALSAYVEGRYVRMSAKDLYDLGFTCDRDNCEHAQADGWSAIYDPEVCELEVYVLHPDLGLTDSARVMVSTGAVMPL